MPTSQLSIEDNSGYLDESGAFCEKLSDAFWTLDENEAITKMNLISHLIETHLNFNTSVTYTVVSWQSKNISNKSDEEIARMIDIRLYLTDDYYDDDVASRSIQSRFKDITGSIVVEWEWEDVLLGLRRFIGFQSVGPETKLNTDELLVVTDCELVSQYSMILDHDDRYLGYANGNINAMVLEKMMADKWKWVNPEAFKKLLFGTDNMILDDVTAQKVSYQISAGHYVIPALESEELDDAFEKESMGTFGGMKDGKPIWVDFDDEEAVRYNTKNEAMKQVEALCHYFRRTLGFGENVTLLICRDYWDWKEDVWLSSEEKPDMYIV